MIIFCAHTRRLEQDNLLLTPLENQIQSPRDNSELIPHVFPNLVWILARGKNDVILRDNESHDVTDFSQRQVLTSATVPP